VRIEDDLLAVEQEAAEELMREWRCFDRHRPRGCWRRWHRGCTKRRHGKRQSVKLRRRCRKHGKCKRHRRHGRQPGVGCWKKTR